jgi:hypothetical protein
MSKTFRRDQLRRLAEQGRLVIAGAYHFDDMTGESRSSGEAIPVALQESGADWRQRVARAWLICTCSTSNPDRAVLG